MRELSGDRVDRFYWKIGLRQGMLPAYLAGMAPESQLGERQRPFGAEQEIATLLGLGIERILVRGQLV